jgi:hypothetical protein
MAAMAKAVGTVCCSRARPSFFFILRTNCAATIQ